VPRLGAVEIVRDGDGVVTIRAQSRPTPSTLGLHAQDQLFQMDMMAAWARSGYRVVGDATVNVDKTMRIRVYRAAEAGLAKLPNEMRVTI
jgi:acyl-homoserine lactone acylase PvdQ